MLLFTGDGVILIFLSIVGGLAASLIVVPSLPNRLIENNSNILKLTVLFTTLIVSMLLVLLGYPKLVVQNDIRIFVEQNIKSVTEDFNNRCSNKYGSGYIVKARNSLNSELSKQYKETKTFNPDIVKGIECYKDYSVN